MADTTIPTNDQSDKPGNDEERHHDVRQEARDEMAAELEKSVLTPLGLLAGLLASVKEEDSNEASLDIVGQLLGLTVHGARKELEIQRIGGRGAYWLQQLLDGWQGENEEGACHE
ncbi:hypothetical protein LJC46_08445 [Desulfovibrio sp. OttesenSCG-928-G15]|nr:hypothetical protein [Desulfovibrio sp. OttesenSCG-928-G15]